jgi:molecular chaperone GrpE
MSENGDSVPDPNAPAGPPDLCRETAPELVEAALAVAEARADAERHAQAYRRVLADFDNFRRRATRDREDAAIRAVGGLLQDLYPVLDTLALSVAAARETAGGEAWAEGGARVQVQLDAVLRRHGVEPIDPAGGLFDPHRHEAIAHERHDAIPEGHLVRVARVGYEFAGRVLRPAAVVVSAGAPAVSSD